MSNKLKRKEINRYLRTISREEKTNECECYLCGSKKNIQQHHILSIYGLSKIAWRENYRTKDKLDDFYLPTEWLCERCHQLVHQLQDDNYNEETLTLDQMYKIAEMYQEVDLEKAPKSLINEYKGLYDDTVSMTVCNFISYGDLTLDELDELENLVNMELGNEFVEEFYKGDDEYER